MGRRSRRRAQGPAAPASTTDYRDPEGNVLTLRDELSAGTRRQLEQLDSKPAASAEDRWQRRAELLFERLAVRWEISGLPLDKQKELLGRYRMASADERRWVRETLDEHLRSRHHHLSDSPAASQNPAVSFPTIEFAAFFVVVFVLSWALMPHPRAWRPFILAASYFFYGWIDWRWVLLLIASSVVNTVAAQVIARSPSDATRKRALIAAVAFDLGLLAVFKYLSFFVSETDNALDSIGLGSSIPLVQIVLPIGISFFTFQAISYVVDVYRRRDARRLARRRGDPPGVLPAPRGRADRAGERAAPAAAHACAIRAPCWPGRRSS